MSTAKRLFLISAGVSAGLTVAILLASAAFYWLASHEKPWNTSAIVASFDRIDDGASGYHDRISIRYVLQNRTTSDVTLTSIRLAAKLRHKGILMDQDQKYLALRTPVFIPAESRASIVIDLPQYSTETPLDANDRAELRDMLLSDFVGNVGDLDGFVLFDDERRYWIDLPKGW